MAVEEDIGELPPGVGLRVPTPSRLGRPPRRRGSSVIIPTPRWQGRYARLTMALDASAALIASMAALAVHMSASPQEWGRYALVAVAFPLVWVACIGAAGGYEQRFLGAGSEEYHRVCLGALSLIASFAMLAWVTDLKVDRYFALVELCLAGVLTLLGRYAWRKQVHRLRKRGRFLHRTLVLGPRPAATDLVRHLQTSAHQGYFVVGVCLTHDDSESSDVRGVPVLGNPNDVPEAVRLTHADTVALSVGAQLGHDRIRRLSWSLEPSGANLVVAPEVIEVAGPRIAVRPIEGLPLLHIEQPALSGFKRVVKSTYEPLLAAVALILLLPFLAAIAIAVRLDSPGPILFRQRRVGMGGEDFTILKFRTMDVDAHARQAGLKHLNEGSGPLFKLRRDPRITRVGAFLRKTSLDELPQLLNVVRGDMSLVGPRPHIPEEVDAFGSDIRRRLLVKPGMTGLWQVSGRSDLSFEESMQADLRYIENWSLALDLSILWKTVAVVLRGSGAY